MKNENLYELLLVAGFLFFCYTILVCPKIEPFWEAYPDVNDYKKQSEASLLSSDFYAPRYNSKIWFSPRPFTVPLFFKIADSDAYKMIMLQKFTYCICVITLLLALLKYFSNFFVKIITQYGLLFFLLGGILLVGQIFLCLSH